MGVAWTISCRAGRASHLRSREDGPVPRGAALCDAPDGSLGRRPDGGDVGGIGLRRAAFEDGRAGDEHVGAGGDDQRRRLRRDAAVDLDIDRPAGRSSPSRARILSSTAGMKAWPPKPGLTVISRIEVEPVEHVFDGALRRDGLSDDAGLLAEGADRLQRAVQMRAGLGVHGDDVGAGLREGLEIGVGRRDHQVARRRASSMRRRIALITGGPKVMLGTKWPSITSRWIQSAPAASMASTSSPRRAKSAERIEGAMIGVRSCSCRVRSSEASKRPNTNRRPPPRRHGEDAAGRMSPRLYGG